MNRERRNTIYRALALLAEARLLIDETCEAEQEAFDNMPEGLQQSERGETMESALSVMGDASSVIEDVESTLEEYSEAPKAKRTKTDAGPRACKGARLAR
jgi:Fe2+ or Zn2+ uptake regulation protein